MNSNLTQIEELIRVGDFDSATKELRIALTKKRSRKTAVKLAFFARRLGRSEWAVKLLYKWVRPSHRYQLKANDEEKIQYAGALSSMGSSEEALLIMDTVQVNSSEYYFTKAMIFIALWNYPQAKVYLKKVLEDLELDHYRRMVTKVNLAAAMADLKEEIYFFDELIVELLKFNYKNLAFELYLILSQNGNKYALELAAKMRPYDFYVLKWQAILSKRKDQMLEIQKLAKDKSYFEIVRDIDFYLASYFKEYEMLFSKLYFGTPYEIYKKKIVPNNIYEHHLEINSYYRFDLNFKSGTLLNKLFKALASDLYAPIKSITLFSKVYPNDFFELHRSQSLINRLINRARKFLLKNEIPMIIEFGPKGYILKGPVVLIYHRVEENPQIRYLKSLSSFTLKKASQLLSKTEKTTLRLLYKHGFKKYGHARNSYYSFN